jgi:predicted solute-binding protein
LVWGFLYGPQRGRFNFRFDLPAQCADALEAGEADIGLVPCAELDRLELDFLPDLGIACEGAVRSIYLVSRTPFRQIRSLAADSSSRTSVALSRILLAEQYGVEPRFVSHAPDLEAMLAVCDAALIIGDPALRLDPASLPWQVLDLGEEWVRWSGLPMVFAVWAGKANKLTLPVAEAFQASYEWGCGHMGEMTRRAEEDLGFAKALAWDYLTKRIVYKLGDRHREGLRLFRELSRNSVKAVQN